MAITEQRARTYAKATANLMKHRFDVTGMHWHWRKSSGVRITKENMLKAIHMSYGIVRRIAQRLDCAVVSVKNFLNRPGNEDCKAAYAEESECIVDRAESALMKSMVQDRDPRTVLNAARFVLCTKGKDKGWQKTITVEGGKHPINVQAAIVDIASLNLPIEMRRDLLARAESTDSLTIEAPKLLPAPGETPIDKPKITIRVGTKSKVVIRKKAG